MTIQFAPSILGFLVTLVLVFGATQFLRSVILDAHTMATEVKTVELPSDPLSHLLFTVEFYNATDEATFAEILGFINKISVLDKGGSIISLESEALACLNLYLYGAGGIRIAPVSGDNQHDAYGLIIPFGRRTFNPDECYPGRKKGDVTLVLDTTVPATTLDNALISISAVALPDATPSRYMKATQRNLSAPGATGEFDAELAMGNDLLALLVGMTSFAGASEYLFGADDLSLIANNRQEAIVSAKAPELFTEMLPRIGGATRLLAGMGGLIPATHTWMDFDPTRDGEFAFATDGLTDLKLRIGYGVNEALTVSQIELVTL